MAPLPLRLRGLSPLLAPPLPPPNAAFASTMERSSRLAASLMQSLKQHSTLLASEGPGRPCSTNASSSCSKAGGVGARQYVIDAGARSTVAAAARMGVLRTLL